ncbi:two component transcriptional regulator, winged helix family [Actinobacteria bacterium OK074]|nr:two component transcriptional regulator, winged helix family [Actinobacteria bacterium OK074]
MQTEGTEGLVVMQGHADERLSSSGEDGPAVLVVTADSGDAELLTATLESAGYRVDVARGAAEGVARLPTVRFDLVVWDATLPDNKNLAKGRRIVLDHRPPILFLITCDYLHTLLPELGGGTEDYVTRPIHATEVLARVEVLLRGRRAEPSPAMPRYGDLFLDEVTRRAWRGARPLDLSPAEYRLLRHMLVNAGQVLSKEQISRHVWSDFRAAEAIEKLVSRLRQKVDQEEPALIHTRRGFGYVFGRSGM